MTFFRLHRICCDAGMRCWCNSPEASTHLGVQEVLQADDHGSHLFLLPQRHALHQVALRARRQAGRTGQHWWVASLFSFPLSVKNNYLAHKHP